MEIETKRKENRKKKMEIESILQKLKANKLNKIKSERFWGHNNLTDQCGSVVVDNFLMVEGPEK